MKAIPLHIFLFFLSNLLFGYDSLVFLKSIDINARLLSTDPIGNIYVVKDNNTLLRLNSDGDSVGIFNEIKKGQINQIDATNPLRILLLFSDYNQIVILNNMLTQKAVLRLNTIGLNKVACMANSADGNIWLYDPSFGSLLKVDEQLDVIQTTNLRNVDEASFAPSDMIEHERALYIADTIDGIRKFDQFGFYNTTYHFNTKLLQFFTNYLVYYQPPYMISYDMQSTRESKIEVPDPNDIIQTRMIRNKLLVLRKQRLDIYELKEK